MQVAKNNSNMASNTAQNSDINMIKREDIYVDTSNVLKFDGFQPDFAEYCKKLTTQELNQCDVIDFNICQKLSDPAEEMTMFNMVAKCCFFCPQELNICVCWLSCIVIAVCWPIICPIFYCCVKNAEAEKFVLKMETQTYERLRDLGSKIHPKKIKLNIYDNYIHSVKIDCLKTFVENSKAEELQLRNKADAADGSNEEWSNFTQNIAPLTKIPNIKYSIAWEHKEFTNMK